MKNQINKLTQSFFESFKGPRTKDYDFEKKEEEFKLAQERMFAVRSIIDNYSARLDGYHLTLNDIVSSFDVVFDRSQTYYCKFMNDVVSAHKSLAAKLRKMFGQIEKLKGDLIKWNDHIINVQKFLNEREAKRKDYEHYDEKMSELYEERNKILLKGKTPSEKDNEKYVRNIQKFQKAAKEYMDASNAAYKNMNQYLDARYENVTLAVVGFIEIEAAFYTDAQYIFNFFKQVRKNTQALRTSFIQNNDEYDAGNFIRGRYILDMTPNELGLQGTSGNAPEKPDQETKGNSPGGGNNMGSSGNSGGYGGNQNLSKSTVVDGGGYYNNPGNGFAGNNLKQNQSYSPYSNNNYGMNNNQGYNGPQSPGGGVGGKKGSEKVVNPFDAPGNPYGQGDKKENSVTNPFGNYENNSGGGGK